MDGENHFRINSQHKSFADRQKNLFAELDKITNNLPQNETEHMDINDDPSPIDNTQRRKVKHYRGKESIFKRPQAPISKCLPHSKRPAFKRNPAKWIKYTLEDVKDEDISEKGNTAAALSFLKELEDRNHTSDESNHDRPEKITFQKTSLIHQEDESETKRTFKNSKLLMPEYVVGQKVKKERRNKGKCDRSPTSKLVLNHLLEEEDDQVD